MKEDEIVVLDLYDELIIDTFLVVKIGDKFVKYNVPCVRKNGVVRTYGDLYMYFTTKKPLFRMAMGYVRQESECGLYWMGQQQYFYFDKYKAPELTSKSLKSPLLLLKRKWEL